MTTNWRDLALCAQTDPAIFHVDKGMETKEAKSVCRQCEVREPCLQFALEQNEVFGVWGGLSEHERRPLRNRPRRTRSTGAAA